MGLDWLPRNKPKPGCEHEFQELSDALDNFYELPENRPQRVFGIFRRRISKEVLGKRRERLKERFFEASISAYETLGVPRVGFDAAADEWAIKRWGKGGKTEPRDEWLQNMRGYYVVELVPPCDGLPTYTNGGTGQYVEAFSFRGQWLHQCLDVLESDGLIAETYGNMTADELMDYGNRLLDRAEAFSRASGIAIPADAPEDDDSPEAHLHIVACAARWCRFWAERGHGLEGYF